MFYFRYLTNGAIIGRATLLRARLGDLAIDIEVNIAAETGSMK